MAIHKLIFSNYYWIPGQARNDKSGYQGLFAGDAAAGKEVQ